MTATPEHRAKYKAKIQQRYYEYKANVVCVHPGCMVTGVEHPELLEFHHRDPSKKKDSVAHMVNQALSWRAIKREIAKCDPLCCEHHKEAHRKLGIPDPRNMPQVEPVKEAA